MNRTVKTTVAVLAAALFASISDIAAAQVHSLRGVQPDTVDKAPQDLQYQGQKPGRQKPIDRTFKEQPPLIPHTLNNFDEITLEENQCMSCHGPEKYKEKNAPKLGDSHMSMVDVPGGGMNKVVNMTRWQCNSCHVPQVDAKPLVDNTFKGNITAKP
ncbi:nitrate reductase cytochrome c-type subunit [Sulfurisoma sediminicola]|uniref:Periplasmic nitrate reductase, electron transfer subunit n=1 Tax=Sulfurisoma sediminicola TaxID=1381557 RepID=A0A497XQN1_9PROT|nr:nitrate reductase cytochrome c-type subunit [Sulfurisoma sediminicola]RLJ68439.1 periplasmic nitrate reductase subunit NapB [Sulfurisoma sediminicola]